MTKTLVETSHRHRHARRPEGMGRHVSAEPAGLTDALDARRQLNRIVEAIAPVSGVELLSTSFDSFDGSIRIELLAPMLSALERLPLETKLRTTAVPDIPNGGMIAVEFVDSALG